MFSGGMDIVLKYCVVLVIINDSLSKRTMKIGEARFADSAMWTVIFKLRYMYKRFSQVGVNDEGLSGNP